MRCTQGVLLGDAVRRSPLHCDMSICIVRRYSRKVAFDTYRLSLSSNVESDITIVQVLTLRIVMHAVSVSVSRVACCWLV
jgi:hypothetical protein